jgi:hypothetical protein
VIVVEGEVGDFSRALYPRRRALESMKRLDVEAVYLGLW